MGKRRKGKKPDGKKSKVFILPRRVSHQDRRGRYIPICDFFCHWGIVKDEDVCQSRSCGYYHRLYIPRDGKVSFEGDESPCDRRHYDRRKL
ncbi:MAG: hypothetical protein WC548_03435 [Candidatus Pacearchaeota archaeon]